MKLVAKVQKLITGRSDLLIALFVMAMIFMMILPLPTWLVDILIGLNMSISLVLLMVAIYIKSPLEFVAFPSVVLLTTIFRLSLSITTTRLILLDGDAGHIVETFGTFVVGGNLVVGLVVFLIITIVQFLVITKGSERVAEVSARFSLDAMPGKQMSIDSDMRAGSIDMAEAKKRRQVVEKESQLFGSMDGAMKFVKGDAIAGIIIIIVNIVGGICIGTLQQGLPIGEAVELYAILTIGDGLVAQIPALMIAVTAGIIVTRVTTDDSKDLGTDIQKQIAAKPLALMIGAALVGLFAFIPGFPTFILLTMAGVIGGVGYLSWRTIERAKKNTADSASGDMLTQSGGDTPTDPKNPQEFEMSVPVIVDVSDKTQKFLNVKILNEEIAQIRQALFFDLGVPFPGIHLRYNKGRKDTGYEVLLHETPIVKGLFKEGHVLVLNQKDQLDILDIPRIDEEAFLPGGQVSWVPEDQMPALKDMGIKYMDLPSILSYHLSFVLKKHAGEFVGLQEAKAILAKIEDKCGELVKEVQRLLPLQKIAEIFQRLVSEDISIRNLRVILESLVEWAQKEKETVMLTEYVRISLKRYISYKYSNGQNLLPSYILDQQVEDMIRNGIRQTSAGAYLALDPRTSANLVNHIVETVGDLSAMSVKPALVVSMDIRRYVRKLIETELYTLPVLSFQELTPEINVQPLARISMPNK
jgi:type III secretion protein V